MKRVFYVYILVLITLLSLTHTRKSHQPEVRCFQCDTRTDPLCFEPLKSKHQVQTSHCAYGCLAKFQDGQIARDCMYPWDDEGCVVEPDDNEREEIVCGCKTAMCNTWTEPMYDPRKEL